jgi:hypothetical protein
MAFPEREEPQSFLTLALTLSYVTLTGLIVAMGHTFVFWDNISLEVLKTQKYFITFEGKSFIIFFGTDRST